MNEQKDVFQSVMESEVEPKPVQNGYSSHSTNATAETIINVLAALLLIAGVIGGFALIIEGANSSGGYYDAGPAQIVFGIIVIFISVIQWAFVKIIINISRNLFNINEFLRERFGDKEA